MKVYLGTDHAGFQLKEKLKGWLSAQGHEVEDMGAHELDSKDDYPDFVAPVAKAVAEDPEKRRGIVLGGSGQGEAMVANRFRGVRAAVFYGSPLRRKRLSERHTQANGISESAPGFAELDIIRLSREHNDANVLSLGARFLTEEEAKEAVKLWLETPFRGEARHVRRIKKIDESNE